MWYHEDCSTSEEEESDHGPEGEPSPNVEAYAMVEAVRVAFLPAVQEDMHGYTVRRWRLEATAADIEEACTTGIDSAFPDWDPDNPTEGFLEKGVTYLGKNDVCANIENLPANKLFLFEVTPYRTDASRRIFPGRPAYSNRVIPFEKLAPGWQTLVSEKGRRYYHHTDSDHVLWAKPPWPGDDYYVSPEMRKNFTQEDMLMLREEFQFFDYDNSGKISEDELQEALGAVDDAKTAEALSLLFRQAQTDERGNISFPEYLRLHLEMQKDNSHPLIKLFRKMKKMAIATAKKADLVIQETIGDLMTNIKDAVQFLLAERMPTEWQIAHTDVGEAGEGMVYYFNTNTNEVTWVLPDAARYYMPDNMVKEFTEKELATIRRIFDDHDSDGNGTMDATELRGALRAINKDAGNMTDKRADLLTKVVMQSLDKDGSGRVEFCEFAAAFWAAREGKMSLGHAVKDMVLRGQNKDPKQHWKQQREAAEAAELEAAKQAEAAEDETDTETEETSETVSADSDDVLSDDSQAENRRLSRRTDRQQRRAAQKARRKARLMAHLREVRIRRMGRLNYEAKKAAKKAEKEAKKLGNRIKAKFKDAADKREARKQAKLHKKRVAEANRVRNEILGIEPAKPKFSLKNIFKKKKIAPENPAATDGKSKRLNIFQKIGRKIAGKNTATVAPAGAEGADKPDSAEGADKPGPDSAEGADKPGPDSAEGADKPGPDSAEGADKLHPDSGDEADDEEEEEEARAASGPEGEGPESGAGAAVDGKMILGAMRKMSSGIGKAFSKDNLSKAFSKENLSKTFSKENLKQTFSKDNMKEKMLQLREASAAKAKAAREMAKATAIKTREMAKAAAIKTRETLKRSMAGGRAKNFESGASLLATEEGEHPKQRYVRGAALYSYTATGASELSLQHGDRVHVYRSEGDGWVLARKVLQEGDDEPGSSLADRLPGERLGFVPASYVKLFGKLPEKVDRWREEKRAQEAEKKRLAKEKAKQSWDAVKNKLKEAGEGVKGAATKAAKGVASVADKAKEKAKEGLNKVGNNKVVASMRAAVAKMKDEKSSLGPVGSGEQKSDEAIAEQKSDEAIAEQKSDEAIAEQKSDV